MYKSNVSGVTYYKKRLYKLDASSVTYVEFEGNKERPPYKKKYYPPTQELLRFLYEGGMKGIVYEERNDIKKIVTSLKTKKNDHKGTTL